MEQNLSTPQHGGTSNSPHVLLAGFKSEEAETIAAALRQMDWLSTILLNEAEITAAFATKRFDVTVIDAEHLEVFAPHLVARLRGTQGPSSDATILVVDHSVFVGFQDQLTQAGADLVVPKPPDPKMYLINFTRAATFRLQSIGIRNS